MDTEKIKNLTDFRSKKSTEMGSNSENNAFKKFYETLSIGEKKFFKQRVIYDCQISEDVFFNWMNRTRINPLAKSVIEKIADCPIFSIDKAIVSDDTNK
jgi:hypothetical protein